jgi:hypothetical protein
MFGRFQSSFFLICLTDLFFCEENIEKKKAETLRKQSAAEKDPMQFQPVRLAGG